MKKLLLAGAIILGMLLEGHGRSEVTILFTGDILLSRGVEAKLIEYGYEYPYANVKQLLKEADITFGNLECPITDEDIPAFKDENLLFKGDYQNAGALKNAGYDILNLANNHVMDYGMQGLEDTVKVLDSQGMHSLGTGSRVQKPVIIETRGIRIGFLGYCGVPSSMDQNAGTDYGVWNINEKSIKEGIKRIRSMCDLLVVSMHWGNEYDFYPNKIQKKYAHLAVDCGADLVVGHHPHVLQGMEIYNGKYILYSLGNFVFDRQIQNGTDEAAVLAVTIDSTGIKYVKILPVTIKDCRPSLVEGKDKEYILERFKLYSEGMD